MPSGRVGSNLSQEIRIQPPRLAKNENVIIEEVVSDHEKDIALLEWWDTHMKIKNMVEIIEIKLRQNYVNMSNILLGLNQAKQKTRIKEEFID